MGPRRSARKTASTRSSSHAASDGDDLFDAAEARARPARRPLAPRPTNAPVPSKAPATAGRRKKKRYVSECSFLAETSSTQALPGRTEEFGQLRAWVKGLLTRRLGGCIYVSGVPGTGKTATVHAAVRSLVHDETVPSGFCVVEINGMRLVDPGQAYPVLLSSLLGVDTVCSAAAAAQRLSAHFRAKYIRRECVVILDELDVLLRHRRQSLLYHFFEWPQWQDSRLVVIAIGNTMDLPERMLSHRIASRLGAMRITFVPYTYPQLMAILRAKMAEKGMAMHPDAVELAARKVAAVSGDARRALHILDRLGEAGGEGTVVGLDRVQTAFARLFATPVVDVIQCQSAPARLVLSSIAHLLNIHGVAAIEGAVVMEFHAQMCRLHRLGQPPLADFLTLLCRLEAVGLIRRGSGAAGLGELQLAVANADVVLALASDPLCKSHLRLLGGQGAQ